MGQRQKTLRGLATVGMVMMLVGVAVLAAFMLSGSSLFQLSVTQTNFNNCRARNLAESAVALGADAVEEAIASNTPGTLGTPTFTLQPPQVPSGCMACLSFNPANPLNCPVSVNNLTGTTAIVGTNNQEVPPGCVQLIGIGQSGACEIHICAILYMPAYPYVVSCSSAFIANGVTIARATGLPSTAPSMAPSVNPSAYLPGDVASNFGLNPAICLQNSTVSGSVRAPGQINVNGTSTVWGAVEIGAPPVALPCINPSMNPACGFSGVQPMPSAPASGGPLNLVGFVNASPGPCGVTTVPGNLNLCGAVLSVQGGLKVQGALTGTGAVFTTGPLTVSGGATLTSDDMIAIVSGGDVTLSASSGQQANFVGLVYTQGNFSATNFHLYGNFVANNKTGSGGNVTMNNSTAVGLDSVSAGLTLGGTVITSCAPTCFGSAPSPGPSGIASYSPGPTSTLGPPGCCPPKAMAQFVGLSTDPVCWKVCGVTPCGPTAWRIVRNSCGSLTITGPLVAGSYTPLTRTFSQSSGVCACTCLCFPPPSASPTSSPSATTSPTSTPTKLTPFCPCPCPCPTPTPPPLCAHRRVLARVPHCVDLKAATFITRYANGTTGGPCGSPSPLCVCCLVKNHTCCLIKAKKAMDCDLKLCCPQPPGHQVIAVGHFVRLNPTYASSPGVVFNFSFNQFISPADQTRVLMWLSY